MSEDNLKIKGQLDTSSSVSALIPTGIIVLKGSLQYSTEENNLSGGFCPCDGRSLNTYTYRNLHKVISNIYGGTAYSEGLTDVPTAITTFNVPNILNFPAQSTNAALGNVATGSNTHLHDVQNAGSISLTSSAYYVHGHNANVGYNGSGNHSHVVGGGVVSTGGPIPGNAQSKKDGNTSTIAGVYHGHNSFTRATATFAGDGDHGHVAAAYQGAELELNSHNHTSTLSFSSTSAGSSIPSFTNLTALIKL